MASSPVLSCSRGVTRVVAHLPTPQDTETTTGEERRDAVPFPGLPSGVRRVGVVGLATRLTAHLWSRKICETMCMKGKPP